MTPERKADLRRDWIDCEDMIEALDALDASEKKLDTAIEEERARCLKIALSRDLTTHEIERKIREGAE